MASAADIVALITTLPPVAFAQVTPRGEDGLTLVYEGRDLASVTVAATDQPAPWAANQVVNLLAHRAVFASSLAELPPAEAVNAAHQVIEWWDAMVCAIAALNRRSREMPADPGNADSRTDRSA